MNPDQPSLTEQLKQLLPEDQRESEPLQRVAELEQATARAQAEREFLERAPREGLLHPADALKLEDLHQVLGAAPDRAAGLAEYYRRLREQRPYLFAAVPAPGARKLSEPGLEGLRRHMTHGALTRQLQAVRIRRK